MGRKIAPMYATRDKWLELLKEYGPLTELQLKRMLGSKPTSSKTWTALLKNGCIKRTKVENPLTGRGCRTYVYAYEYVKDPLHKRLPPSAKQIEKARAILAGSGWTLIPPKEDGRK